MLRLASALARILPNPAKRALYKLGPLTGLIRNSLNRAVPAGLTETTVAGGVLQGARFQLDLRSEKDYWLGTYELELQAAVRDWVKPGMTAYDVGANIGYITVMLAQAVGAAGRVFSFEALPANVERLRSNVALNPLANVTAIHAAVVALPSPVKFLLHASHGMGKATGSAGRDESYSGTIEVPGITLDHFVYEQGYPPPDVIKMDIEGGETLALPGAARTLRKARPLIFLELHGESAARTAWEELTAAGYTLHQMKPGCPRITSLAELNWKAYVVGQSK
jgi:FkbM family methyltransferase